jgi:hypothetical protein
VFRGVRTALQAIGALVGQQIDERLDAFARYICETRPARIDVPGSTDVDEIRGYVIPGHDGSPYMTRILFPRVLGVRVMLHNIHREDHERDLHDHPWPAVSLILRGSYDEERPVPCHHADECSVTVTKRVRWYNWLRVGDWHRITKLHGNVWTLFVSGERTTTWGFREWCDDGTWIKTPSKEYIAKRAYEATLTPMQLYEGACYENRPEAVDDYDGHKMPCDDPSCTINVCAIAHRKPGDPCLCSAYCAGECMCGAWHED